MTTETAGDEQPSVRRAAAGFAAVLAAGSAALLAVAPSLITIERKQVRYYESPLMMPMLALAIIAVCATIHVTKVLRGAPLSTDDIEEPTAHWGLVLIAMAAYAVYIAVVPLIGYVAGTATFIVATGLLARLGVRRSLATALLVTAVLFGLFVVALHVWFPTPLVVEGL
jgi:hypothetical protein